MYHARPCLHLFAGGICLFGLSLTLCLGPALGETLTLDFDGDRNDGFAAGQIIDDEYHEFGVSIWAMHPRSFELDVAVVVDSDSPQAGDLSTPGFGAFNRTARDKVLIVPDRGGDLDGDGWSDSPKLRAEPEGGRLFFEFDQNYDWAVATVIDLDFGEEPGQLVARQYGDEVAITTVTPAGDNSVQTVSLSGAKFDSLEVELKGSGGVVAISVGQRPSVVPTPTAFMSSMIALAALALRRKRSQAQS